MFRFLRKLDEHRFLGLPIWEFSVRSMPRSYGHAFVLDVLLRHPLRAMKGLQAYRRFYRHGHRQGDVTRLFAGSDADLRAEIGRQDEGFLVALGFCQKSLGPGTGCPAGRFNHDCRVIGRDDLLDVRPEQLPATCRECDVRVIGAAALEAGASFYIMTSALDISRHLLIPTLRGEGFKHGLFLLCRYSIPAMILPLLICDIRSVLFGYAEGYCRDYAQFLLADEGTKHERTFLSPTARDQVLRFLQQIAADRRATGVEYSRFRRDGCVFAPVRQGTNRGR